MPVIAVINRKGGSGKSTMATHLAAWLACQGAAVMLGDVDRQQSTRTWLKRRSSSLPAIAPWAIDQKNVLKVPVGVTHVVLDTPGGLHGFELAKVVMASHAILIPVCNSVFDRESAAACIAELMALPRLTSGRCKLGVVGMRIDARTHAAQTLREWAEEINQPFLGVLRETQIYVRSLDSGQTIFDMHSAAVQSDLDQWKTILQWLQPVTQLPAKVAVQTPTKEETAQPLPAPRAPSLMPAQESLVHGSRLSVLSPASPSVYSDVNASRAPRRGRDSHGAPASGFLQLQ
jgi:chromosome partitioning protein